MLRSDVISVIEQSVKVRVILSSMAKERLSKGKEEIK